MADDAVPVFWGHPDPRRATAKAVWMQRRELVANAVRDCLAEFAIDQPAVALLGGDERLAQALTVDLRLTVRHVAQGRPPRSHVIVTELEPNDGHQERVNLLARAFAGLWAGGKCVVIGTVVAPPGADRGTVASLGQVVREFGLAWRESYHVDEVRSFRWLNEPFVRGVVLTVTSLGVAPEMAR